MSKGQPDDKYPFEIGVEHATNGKLREQCNTLGCLCSTYVARVALLDNFQLNPFEFNNLQRV